MQNRKRNTNRKPKAGNFRGKDKKTQFDSQEVAQSKRNDPSWYTVSGQLTKDVASLSFNNALGVTTTLNYQNPTGDYSLPPVYKVFPGIMSIYTSPSMGISTNGSSALNLAAKNFYSFIRHQNSGHANYDSPDLMLYFGAMDSVYSALAFMMRAYGVARVFSQTNRYVGDALLTAMGVEPTSFRRALSDVRAYINTTITKVSAFCVPNTMKLFLRHFWMYSGVYRDEDISKSQMYLYVPATLWKYYETGVGQLVAENFAATYDGASFTTSAKSYASYENIIDGMVAALVSSEDINIMSGDILKAYGRENLWTLNLIPEDWVVMPSYDVEIAEQIHNTVFTGEKVGVCHTPSEAPIWSLASLNVSQDPTIGDGSLFFQPHFVNAGHLAYTPVIDMFDEAPTPERVITATRNIVTAGVEKLSGTSTIYKSHAWLTSAGADIPLFAKVWKLDARGGLNGTEMYDGEMWGQMTGDLADLIPFKNFPRYLTYDTTNRRTYVMGEIGNYTVVSTEDVAKLNDTAMLSLLGVPYLGTAQQV